MTAIIYLICTLGLMMTIFALGMTFVVIAQYGTIRTLMDEHTDLKQYNMNLEAIVQRLRDEQRQCLVRYVH